MRLIIIAVIACIASYHACGQTIRKDAQGNYHAVKDSSKSVAIPTGKTYTDSKGVVYPVFKTSKGKLFVEKTSGKTGKKYRYYLKLNDDK